MGDFSSSEGSEISEMSAFSEWDSDDDDLGYILKGRVRPKNHDFFEVTAQEFNMQEFIEHFRVSRQLADSISEQFAASDFFKNKQGPYEKLTPLQHTYIFLWYAGHQTAGFRDVADRFNITISSLHRVLQRMIYFLSNLAPQVIKWPTEEEKLEIEEYFRRKNRFPGVIGVIDRTHIKLDKPQEDPESYINRKGFYSIQVQLVCDHRLKIRSMFTGYPGSVHDTRVFRTSPLFQTLPERCQDFHLLGDSAYPLLRNMLVPFPDRGHLTRQQLNYNFKHSSNRIIIEHCNGILKQKWRQLYHLKLRNIRNIAHFIRACCVLHNLALDDIAVEDYNADEQEMDNGPDENGPEELLNENQDLNGTEKRNIIMNNLPLN